MRIVKVRFPAADLSREMAAMREWLDSNRYEPAKFDCGHDGVDVVLSVEFMLDEAAKAFANALAEKTGRGHPLSTARSGSPHSDGPERSFSQSRPASARKWTNRVAPFLFVAAPVPWPRPPHNDGASQEGDSETGSGGRAMWRPSEPLAFRGGTESSNLLCSSVVSGANLAGSGSRSSL